MNVRFAAAENADVDDLYTLHTVAASKEHRYECCAHQAPR